MRLRRTLEAPPRGGASAVAERPPSNGGRLRALFDPGRLGDAIVDAAPVVPARTIVARFWPDARPYRRWIVAGLVALAVVPAVEAAQVWLFKLLVDSVLVAGDLGPLVWIGAIAVGLTLAAGALSFAEDYLAAWVGERFLLAVRTRVYRHLLRQSPAAIERRRLGDLLARVSSDVQAIEDFLLGSLADAVSSTVRIAIFVGALFLLDAELALVALVAAPIFWLVAKRFAGLIKAASREKRRRTGTLGAVAEEGLANAAVVQAFGRREFEVDRFAREGRGILDAELAATRLRALFSPINDVIELAGALVVVAWGTWAISQGRLSLGGLLAFMTYLALLYRPVRDLGNLGTTLFAASAAAERIIELLDQEPAVQDAPGALPVGQVGGAVELDRVSFRYPGARDRALRDVSLSVAPGETIAIVGASGSGKTTLARLVLRFYDPDAGSVRLDGRDLRSLELASLRESVAVVLQEGLVFDGTIRENIAYGREGATDAEIEAATAAAGLDELVAALPEGYETRIGQKGRRLSGGQRARLGLARALVRDAPVLVLDEPFAGLDPASVDALVEPLLRATEGRTTLLVTHEREALRLAHRIVEVDGGRIVGCRPGGRHR